MENYGMFHRKLGEYLVLERGIWGHWWNQNCKDGWYQQRKYADWEWKVIKQNKKQNKKKNEEYQHTGVKEEQKNRLGKKD